MADDLIERLHLSSCAICREVTPEFARLRAEVARLTEASGAWRRGFAARGVQLERLTERADMAEMAVARLIGERDALRAEVDGTVALMFNAQQECDGLRTEVEALRQERQGWVDSSKMHESWLTKPREALLDGLRFQGATTAHLLEETTRLTGKLEAAKSALCKYGRHTISTDPACQMYANSSLPCNCGYIAAIDAARSAA